jgi:hypothetical protein
MVPAPNNRLEAPELRPIPTRNRRGGIHHVRDVLDELLDRYREKFPEIEVTVVHEPVTVT